LLLGAPETFLARFFLQTTLNCQSEEAFSCSLILWFKAQLKQPTTRITKWARRHFPSKLVCSARPAFTEQIEHNEG
jgi:hypothetical protein